jgi:hypothetical protein
VMSVGIVSELCSPEISGGKFTIHVKFLCIHIYTHSKTSLILASWERTLDKTSESLNYGSATGNMFRKVIKRASCVFLSNKTLF